MSDTYTQAQLDAIRAAIAKGEKSVTFADRTVVYRSMDELLKAEARIAAAVAATPKQTIVVAPRD
jgi:hypothetical protein